MIIMIISIAGFMFLLTLLIFGKTIRAENFKRDQMRAMRNEVKYLDEELEKTFFQRFIQPIWKKMAKGLSRVANRMNRKSGKKNTGNALLEAQLKKAGIKMGVHEYQLVKMFFYGVILSGGIFAALSLSDDVRIQLLLLIAALMAMVVIPRYYLKARIKNRMASIQNDLPNVMDILSVSIEAGLGFDAAVLRAVEKFDGPLIDEMAQMAKEVQMGISRRDALTALGERNDVGELQMFVSAVVQSEQFGTPIKNVLNSQAKQLRTSRKQRAQEKGMKAPVKMTLPMVLFIFPVIFIILLGPTVISIMDQFM